MLSLSLIDAGAVELPGNARTAVTARQPTATNPAIAALLRVARSQAEGGQGEQAAATLERALRIEPHNPWLWHRLAVLRLQQGYRERAAELAKKSTLLARNHPRLRAGNQRVIQAARAEP